MECKSINTDFLFKMISDSRNAVSNSYQKGMTIFMEGTPCYGVYIIKHGQVKISHLDKLGNETVLYVLHDGDILNLSSLFVSGNLHEHTAMVIEKSDITYLDNENLLDEIGQLEKGEVIKILTSSSRYLQQAEKRILNAYQKNVKQRLLCLLHDLVERFGDNEDGKIYIDIQLYRNEMAAMIGTSPETLIRIMSDLKKKKIIEEKNKKIYVLNLDYINTIAA